MPGPASGIPAQGMGWGGEARGAGTGGPARPFGPGNTASVGRPDPDQTRIARRAEQAETLKDRLFKAADVDIPTPISIAAAREFLNCTEGLPVARTITHSTDDASELDDAALLKRQQELEAALRGDAGGGASEEVPG